MSRVMSCGNPSLFIREGADAGVGRSNCAFPLQYRDRQFVGEEMSHTVHGPRVRDPDVRGLWGKGKLRPRTRHGMLLHTYSSSTSPSYNVPSRT